MVKWNPPKFIIGLSGVGTLIGGIVILREYVSGGDFVYKENLVGKTAIITGANSGIGKETAHELARRGATVVMACRNMKKCMEIRKEFVLETKNKYIYCEECDLASLKSIRKFAESTKDSFKKVDILINNAGVMRCPKSVTKDGFEMQFGTNHLGHFLLTLLLLERIKAAAPSRIINVSSVAHLKGKMDFTDLNREKEYDAADAYYQSKLANVLFTVALADKLQGTGVTCNAVHPGLVNTHITRHMSIYKSWVATIFIQPFMWLLLKTPHQGAQNILHAALSEELETVTGKYFSNQIETPPSEISQDRAIVQRLWAISEAWCGIS